MLKDIEILTVMRNDLLNIIGTCHSKLINEPLDTSMCKYIQDVAKHHIENSTMLRHIVAIEESKVLNELINTPIENLFNKVCEAREILDAAIVTIEKMHFPKTRISPQ